MREATCNSSITEDPKLDNPVFLEKGYNKYKDKYKSSRSALTQLIHCQLFFKKQKPIFVQLVNTYTSTLSFLLSHAVSLNFMQKYSKDTLFTVKDCTRMEPYSIPRRAWVKWNWLTWFGQHGYSGQMLHKWGFRSDPSCSCEVQSMHHIFISWTGVPKHAIPVT